MNEFECILCKNTTASKVEEIPVLDLVSLYKELLDVSVASQFKGMDTVAAYVCSHCSFEYFNPLTAGDKSFYEQLQEKRTAYYSPDRKEFMYAEKYITDTDKILEIGSGNGLFATRLRKENYIGLEFNDRAISDAASQGIKLLKQSVEDFAITSQQQFDVVCSFHVLEHVTNPYAFIKSKISLLKTGGTLIIAVPCNDSIYTSNYNHVLNLPPHHIGRWRIKTMQSLETLFPIECVDFSITSSNPNINKRDYIAEIKTQQKVAALNSEKRYILDSSILKQARKWTYRFNKYFGLYHFYPNKRVIGENMTFVFKKK